MEDGARPSVLPPPPCASPRCLRGEGVGTAQPFLSWENPCARSGADRATSTGVDRDSARAGGLGQAEAYDT